MPDENAGYWTMDMEFWKKILDELEQEPADHYGSGHLGLGNRREYACQRTR